VVELLQPDRVSVLGVVLQQGLRFAATWHPGSSRILGFFCLLLLVNVVPWDGCGGCRVSYNPNFPRLKIELRGAHQYLSFRSRVSPRVVLKVNRGGREAWDVARERTNCNLRMRLSDFNLIFKVDRCVTLNLKLLFVGVSNSKLGAEVDNLGELVTRSGVNDGEGVDGDQNFVAFAVDSNRVVEVLVFVNWRRE